MKNAFTSLRSPRYGCQSRFVEASMVTVTSAASAALIFPFAIPSRLSRTSRSRDRDPNRSGSGEARLVVAIARR